MSSTSSSSGGDAEAPQVNCSTNDLSGLSQEEKLEHAKNLSESLEAQQKYIEDLHDQELRFDSTTFEDKKTPHFRRLKRCKIVLSDALKITRVMMHACEDCTLHIRSRVLTSTLEIWECKRVVVDVNADLKTIQADLCDGLKLRYHKGEHFGSIVQSGNGSVILEIHDEGVNEEVGFDAIERAYPEHATKEEHSQFFTRFIKGDVLIEKIIRTKEGFPTTLREMQEQAPKGVEVNEETLNEERANAKKDEGNTAFRAGHIQQAVVYYSEALMIKKDHVAVLSNRAFCFIQMGEFEKALEDAARCVELDPSFTKGHFRKGLALSKLDRHPEALTAFEQAQKLDPKNANIAASVKMALYKASQQARGESK